MKFNKKNILNIFIYILLISLFVFLYYQSSQIEGLETSNNIDTSISTNFANSFCINNQTSGTELNEQCQKLTALNCEKTDCCMWTENNKCVAGSKKNGPLFTE